MPADTTTLFVEHRGSLVNYANGIPVFCVSVGLVVDGRPVLGVIYDPIRDELFSAQAGLGARLDGFFGDCAVTVPVGRVTEDAAELLRVTEEALFRGIEAVKPGARVSDIGEAVQQHVALLDAFRRSPLFADSKDWALPARIDARISESRAWLTRRALRSGEGPQSAS